MQNEQQPKRGIFSRIYEYPIFHYLKIRFFNLLIKISEISAAMIRGLARDKTANQPCRTLGTLACGLGNSVARRSAPLSREPLASRQKQDSAKESNKKLNKDSNKESNKDSNKELRKLQTNLNS